MEEKAFMNEPQKKALIIMAGKEAQDIRMRRIPRLEERAKQLETILKDIENGDEEAVNALVKLAFYGRI